MEPTLFGDPALFGLYHPPVAAGRACDVGILVCPPVGHEHTRSHRALKILSQSLARAGFHVLRFDYRGLGDSAGDASDGTVEGWCHDIVTALGELQELSGARELGMVGLRLGATLAAAALASLRPQRRLPKVGRLVLWDPVLSGLEYLDVASRLQATFVSDPGRFPRGRSLGVPAGGDDGPVDLLGYHYSTALRRSLRELDLRRIEPWPGVATSFVLTEASPACERLAVRLHAVGRSVSSEVVDDSDGSWGDYEGHETTLRAGRAVRAVLAQLDTRHP